MHVMQAWDEDDRMMALHETGVLDTVPEEAFDTIVALAAQLFRAPMATVTLIDDRRQWFKSQVGMGLKEGPRSESLCAVAVQDNRPLILPDVRADPRFRDVPAVRAGTFAAYAGVPLTGRDGLALGTLCVLDGRPREFAPAQIEALRALAHLASDALELRRRDTAAGVDPTLARALAQSIRDAIQQGQLVLHYQPIMDLATGRVHSVEALVRWKHPTRGLLGPDAFLPAAELAGLGNALDRWVLHQAALTVHSWRTVLPHARHLRLAVNVTLRASTTLAWAKRLLEVLASTGMPSDSVTMEVSERSVGALTADALTALQHLQSHGVGIAIDDVGTGTSSLARVADTPATQIKIDRSFVTNITSDHRRAAMVAALCRLGQELNLEVVSEGVEDEATAARMGALGATHGQGYFFSKPLPAHESTRIVRPIR